MAAIAHPAPVPRTRKSTRFRHPLRRGSFGLLVVVIAVWSLFPFAWQVITSFEPDRDLSRFAPTWLPIPGGTLQHYRNVFVAKDFAPYIVNCLFNDAATT